VVLKEGIVRVVGKVGKGRRKEVMLEEPPKKKEVDAVQSM